MGNWMSNHQVFGVPIWSYVQTKPCVKEFPATQKYPKVITVHCPLLRSWVGKIFSKCWGRKNGLCLAPSNAILTFESGNGGAIDQQVQGTFFDSEKTNHPIQKNRLKWSPRVSGFFVSKSWSQLNPIFIFYQTNWPSFKKSWLMTCIEYVHTGGQKRNYLHEGPP